MDDPSLPTCMNSSGCIDGFAKTRIIDDGYKSLESWSIDKKLKSFPIRRSSLSCVSRCQIGYAAAAAARRRRRRRIIPLLLDLKYLAIKASNNVPSSCPDMSMCG